HLVDRATCRNEPHYVFHNSSEGRFRTLCEAYQIYADNEDDGDPRRAHDRTCDDAALELSQRGGFAAQVRYHLFRYQCEANVDADRQKQNIVEISEDRNKIRNEVDRRKRVSNDED